MNDSCPKVWLDNPSETVGTKRSAVDRTQLLTYLKLGGWKVGPLMNFNVPVLKDGIRRRMV